jgi:hypothetical protein
MQNSFLAKVILLLSFFHISALAAPDKFPAVIGVRQTASTPNDPLCLDYSITANLSTIGANSTYRSAFLQASPLGNFPNAKMLNAAIAKLPKLTRDVGLNKACGNLTTVAFTEAEQNYTKGIVAQFSGLKGDQQSIQSAGPELIAIVAVVCMCFGLVFMIAP